MRGVLLRNVGTGPALAQFHDMIPDALDPNQAVIKSVGVAFEFWRGKLRIPQIWLKRHIIRYRVTQ